MPDASHPLCMQRLIVDSALDSSLLMSLRNVALGRTSDRFRFTVHSQALCVVRLRFADLKTVRLSQKQTAPAGGETWGQAASEHLLPVMYLYSVRVPALHQLTVRVEANQPVVLAASEDRLGALVSSSPSTLVEVRTIRRSFNHLRPLVVALRLRDHSAFSFAGLPRESCRAHVSLQSDGPHCIHRCYSARASRRV